MDTADGNILQVTPMLHIPRLDEARHFFETILGFQVMFAMDGYFYCEREGAGIRVLEEDQSLKPLQGKRTRITVYVDVQDVDGLYAELQTRLEALPQGYVKPPKDYHWKQRELHVQMPDGNVLAFGQAVKN
jgi:catechol 2,3-dioxygenase-like lactoylglutathione lyase family enzyme